MDYSSLYYPVVLDQQLTSLVVNTEVHEQHPHSGVPYLFPSDENTLYDTTSVRKSKSNNMSYLGGASAPTTTSSSSSSSSSYHHQPPPYAPAQQPQGHQQQQQGSLLLKRKMTLDLNTAKRARSLFSTGHTPTTADILSSPDIQMLKIPTPELDNFAHRLIGGGSGTGVLQTPTSVFFPKNVTEEQELYVKGFEHALASLHQGSNSTAATYATADDNSSTASSYGGVVTSGVATSSAAASSVPPPKYGAGGAVGTQTSYHDFSNVIVKEEPQTVPEQLGSQQRDYFDDEDDVDDEEDDDDDDDLDDDDEELRGGGGGSTSGRSSVHDESSNSASGLGGGSGRSSGGKHLNPIDMVSQEKIKLERKRQRNRLAASKCRRKKLERISKLEDKVKQLKTENNELGNVLVKLRESVQVLKSQVLEHVQAGCPIILNSGGQGSGSSTGLQIPQGGGANVFA